MIAYRNQSDQFVFNSFVDHFPSLQKFIVFASLFVFCSVPPFPFLFHFLTSFACWSSLTVLACGEQDRKILKQERGLEILRRKKTRKHWFCKKRAVSFSSSSSFSSLQGVFCSSVFLYLFGSFYLPTVFCFLRFLALHFHIAFPRRSCFVSNDTLCFFCFLHFCIASLRKFSSVILLLALPFIVLHTHTLSLFACRFCVKVANFPLATHFCNFYKVGLILHFSVLFLFSLFLFAYHRKLSFFYSFKRIFILSVTPH